jgi:hypothetical protein
MLYIRNELREAFRKELFVERPQSAHMVAE